MSVTEVLREIQGRGIVLEAAGDKLRYRAPKGSLTPGLVAAMRTYKGELLQALRIQAEALPPLPDSILTSRNPLAALARLALDSLPAAHRLNATERRIIADALEAVTLRWLSEILKPEEIVREESNWRAFCRKGHPVRDAIFVRQCVGWVCQECSQVFAPSECKLQIAPQPGGWQ